MDRLKGKVALVSGGAMGIGKSACLLMAREGAKIAVTDLEEAQGASVVEEIRGQGGDAAFWRLDVANEAEVRRVFGAVQGRFGPITVLVANAGISGANKPTHELSEQEWDRVQGINVKGVFFCTKHAVPQMKKAGGGSIINLSSIYGLVGAPDVTVRRGTPAIATARRLNFTTMSRTTSIPCSSTGTWSTHAPTIAARTTLSNSPRFRSWTIF